MLLKYIQSNEENNKLWAALSKPKHEGEEIDSPQPQQLPTKQKTKKRHARQRFDGWSKRINQKELKGWVKTAMHPQNANLLRWGAKQMEKEGRAWAEVETWEASTCGGQHRTTAPSHYLPWSPTTARSRKDQAGENAVNIITVTKVVCWCCLVERECRRLAWTVKYSVRKSERENGKRRWSDVSIGDCHCIYGW